MSQSNELIDECRQQIDTIDQEIVTCLVRRINITKDIAGYKKLADIPIQDEEREHQVIDMVRDFTEGLVNEESKEKMQSIINRIYRTILDETRRYEYGCKCEGTVIDAEYVGAPKAEPLFTCNSQKAFDILDREIERHKHQVEWNRNYHTESIKSAMERLTATLYQINELFELHRRIEKAGYRPTQADIMGDSAVKITVKMGDDGKYYLYNSDKGLAIMDGDGKFYVNCMRSEDILGLGITNKAVFHNEVTFDQLAELIKNGRLHDNEIGEYDIVEGKTIADVSRAFDSLARGLASYSQGLMNYISELRSLL